MSQATSPNSIGGDTTGGTRIARRRAARRLHHQGPTGDCEELPPDVAESTSFRPPSRWARTRKPVASPTNNGLRPSRSDISSEDPLHNYLADVGSIALLSRDEERSVAKAVESNRSLFRRSLLVNEFVLRAVVEQLKDVQNRRQRPERVIDVAVAGSAKKSSIMNRLAPNLETLAALLNQNGEDFRLAMFKKLQTS